MSLFFSLKNMVEKATGHGLLSLQSWLSCFSELLMQVFADHKSSHDPIHVVREQLWNLQRRMVYFGTSVPSIFKGYDQHTSPIQRNLICKSTNSSYFPSVGLTTEEVQQCFWRGKKQHISFTTHFSMGKYPAASSSNILPWYSCYKHRV